MIFLLNGLLIGLLQVLKILVMLAKVHRYLLFEISLSPLVKVYLCDVAPRNILEVLLI